MLQSITLLKPFPKDARYGELRGKNLCKNSGTKAGGRHLLVNEGVQFWDFTVMLLLTLGCVTFLYEAV